MFMPPLAICAVCCGPEVGLPVSHYKAERCTWYCVVQCAACLLVGFPALFEKPFQCGHMACMFINANGTPAVLRPAAISGGLTLVKQGNRWGDETAPELLRKGRVPLPRFLPCTPLPGVPVQWHFGSFSAFFQHRLGEKWCCVAPSYAFWKEAAQGLRRCQSSQRGSSALCDIRMGWTAAKFNRRIEMTAIVIVHCTWQSADLLEMWTFKGY